MQIYQKIIKRKPVSQDAKHFESIDAFVHNVTDKANELVEENNDINIINISYINEYTALIIYTES